MESGIPTYRDDNGIWNTYAEETASAEMIKKNPESVWDLSRVMENHVDNAIPNVAHETLALFERQGLDVTIITQNIDDLHERARSKKIIHLHGRIHRLKCQACDRISVSPRSDVILECECGGALRYDVVLFGEFYRSEDWHNAVNAMREADLVMVVGTSLRVEPAASLLRLKPNEVISINPRRDDHSSYASVQITEDATVALCQLSLIGDEGFVKF